MNERMNNQIIRKQLTRNMGRQRIHKIMHVKKREKPKSREMSNLPKMTHEHRKELWIINGDRQTHTELHISF
jgi:hypothetical protein